MGVTESVPTVADGSAHAKIKTYDASVHGMTPEANKGSN